MRFVFADLINKLIKPRYKLLVLLFVTRNNKGFSQRLPYFLCFRHA